MALSQTRHATPKRTSVDTRRLRAAAEECTKFSCYGVSSAHDDSLDSLFSGHRAPRENARKSRVSISLWPFSSRISLKLIVPPGRPLGAS
jgi:hypothetical protein